ncbi:MAG: hypothetical protein ACMXYK_03685, partial [Candidatus Woesearchaeota archaeon]
MAKREDEYELVPEGRFHYLENKVIEIFKNPIIKNTTAKDLAEALEKNNKSVDALISILRTIQADTKFEDKEQSIIKKEMHPLVLAVKEIQQQNNTFAKSMLNIIDRLNDINDT